MNIQISYSDEAVVDNSITFSCKLDDKDFVATITVFDEKYPQLSSVSVNETGSSVKDLKNFIDKLKVLAITITRD